MKKTITACLLAALLMLAGCKEFLPADISQNPSASETESVANHPPIEVEESSSEEASSSQPAPMPEGLPATTPEAVGLPDKLFTTAADGYSVELLTPAQYSVYQAQNGGGYRGFQTADYFELKSQEGEKFALANKNGKILTGFVFDDDGESWFFQNGNSGVALRKDGKYGVVDGLTGEELLPFQYDSISAERNDTFICATGDTYELMDRDGQVLLTYSRGDELTVFPENYLLLENGMLRFYDSQMRPIKNFACEAVRPSVVTNLILVKSGGKWGVCDPDGDFKIDPQYDDIDYFNEHCEAAVFTKNGKKGVVDPNGEVLIKAQWDDVALFDSSASVEKDGKWGAFTDLSDAEPEIEPMYDFIYGFGADNCAAYEQKGKFGVLDEDGNILISARYDRIATNSLDRLEKGYYALEGDGPLLYGIISGKGSVVIPDTYTILFSDEEEPYHLIMTQRGQWGYIDREGQMVIDTKFENADQFRSGKDVAFVKKDGKLCMINRKGVVVLETVFSDLVSYHPDTMVGAFEYTDAQGNVKCCLAKVVPPSEKE